MSAIGSQINSSLIKSNLSVINLAGTCEFTKDKLNSIIQYKCSQKNEECFLCKLIKNLLGDGQLFKRLDKLIELYLIPFNICPIHEQVNEHINETTNNLYCHQCINDILPDVKEINPNNVYYGLKQSFNSDLEDLKKKLNHKLQDPRLLQPPRNQDLEKYFKGKKYTQFISRIASKTTHRYMHERWKYEIPGVAAFPYAQDKLDDVNKKIKETIMTLNQKT